MGHISIVTQESFKSVIETGHVSVSAFLDGKLKMKTFSDQFADLLNVKKGDIIFFWVIKDKVNQTENLGFIGYTKATGNAIFVKTEKFPYKIPVDEICIYDFPLSERQALSLNHQQKLWNLIGKKSLGRGRGLIHQTPFEDEILLKLLNQNSPSHQKIQPTQQNFVSEPIKIVLNNSQISVEKFNKENFELEELNMNFFPFTKNNLFSYEKTLEAFFMETFRDNKFQKILKLLGLESFSLEWVGNYLAYGVLGGNIDILILLKKDNQYLVVVLELKNENLNDEETKKVINQVNEYSLEMKETFETFIKTIEVKKVVVAPSFSKEVEKSDVMFLKYGITNNEFTLE